MKIKVTKYTAQQYEKLGVQLMHNQDIYVFWSTRYSCVVPRSYTSNVHQYMTRQHLVEKLDESAYVFEIPAKVIKDLLTQVGSRSIQDLI